MKSAYLYPGTGFSYGRPGGQQKGYKNNLYRRQRKTETPGKVVFEPGKKRGEKDKLVITEIPYTMIGANIGKFLSDVVNLVESKENDGYR